MKRTKIREVSSLDPLVSSLIRRTFLRFEAPDYSEEGIRSFMDFLNNKEQMAGLIMFGAYVDNELAGVIAAQNELSHICLFFVDEPFQRQGIGRKLWEQVLSSSRAVRITVNSSPYAVEIYRRLGFQNLSEERLTDGMRYTPMEYCRV